MSVEDRTNLIQQVHAFTTSDETSALTEPSVASTSASRWQPPRGRGSGGASGSGPFILVSTGYCFLTNESKPILPVPIDNHLTHVSLSLGPSEQDAVVLPAVIDTAAALCTGNYDFMSAFARKHPHTVAGVYTPNSFSPIGLSGIVQNDGKAVTTQLPVAFAFHTPLFTKDGRQCQILVACGRQVSVNLILGISFLKSAGAVIDYSDNVVQLRNLDCSLLNLTHKVARLTAPDASTIPSANSAQTSLTKTLDKLDLFVAQVLAAHDPASVVYPPETDDDEEMDDASNKSNGSTASRSSIDHSIGSSRSSSQPPENGLISASNNSLANYREPILEEDGDSNDVM
jgi:hypothetical protein